eukprot:Clim_evm25s66 gene=Clim_evmTU25s66
MRRLLFLLLLSLVAMVGSTSSLVAAREVEAHDGGHNHHNHDMVIGRDHKDAEHDVACPVCGMSVDPQAEGVPTYEFKDGQKLYFCPMGHDITFAHNPVAYVDTVKGGRKEDEKMTAETLMNKDEKYHCPVTGLPVPGDRNPRVVFMHGQSIKTADREAAWSLATSPEHFKKDKTVHDKCGTKSTRFCQGGGTVMANGFSLPSYFGGEADPCITFLIDGLVLNTAAKYGGGLACAFVLSFLQSFFGLANRIVHMSHQAQSAQQKSSRKSGSDTAKRPTLTGNGCCDDNEGHSEQEQSALLGADETQQEERPARPSQACSGLTGETPLWLHASDTVLTVLGLLVGYVMMLLVMTYDAGLFIFVLLGYGCGFLTTKMAEAQKRRKQREEMMLSEINEAFNGLSVDDCAEADCPDPCCPR